MGQLKELICGVVRDSAARANGATRYRSPVIGCSSIDQGEFTRLQKSVPQHLTPEELLPGARGLVSYFLPLEGDIDRANACSNYVAHEWAVAYVETNELLSAIAQQLVEGLAVQGVRAAAEAPTYLFDNKTLMARWSHKSIAYMTGIGSFGLHRMVITDAGCAGRFGSLVVDADFGGNAIPHRERCLYYHNGTCGLCVAWCPVSALEQNGSFDRARCYQRLLEVDAHFSDLPLTDVCRKCAVGLPCLMANPVSKGGSRPASCSGVTISTEYPRPESGRHTQN